MSRFLGILVLNLLFVIAYAQVPSAISYQGIILDPATGETAANGTHSVKFAFYDAAENGNFKWETSTIQVTSFKGLFTTVIPIPENTTWSTPLYVQLTVDGVVLSSRIQMTTVPFAFQANVASSATSMNASGLIGTIADARLSTHLQDLADGSLSGSKVGAGINAAVVDNGLLPNSVLDDDLKDLADDGVLSAARIGEIEAGKTTSGIFDAARIPDLDATKITTGTIDPARLPGSLVSGTGAANRIAYWSDTNVLGHDNPGMVWQEAENEIGINVEEPLASLHVVHDASHSSTTAMKVENTSSVNLDKKGIDVFLSNNPSTVDTYGINVTIDNSGNGTKHGVHAFVNTALSHEVWVSGGSFNASGEGIGTHYGVYGTANSSGQGQNVGVRGEASGVGSLGKTGVEGYAEGSGGSKYGVVGNSTGTGTSHYGVYGAAFSASNNNYGLRGLGSGGTNAYGVYGSANGGGNNYAVYASGVLAYTGGLLNASDKRLKKNIAPLSPMLSKILLLKPSNYYMRKDEFPGMNLTDGKKYGLIAQDVEKIFPEIVMDNAIDEGLETEETSTSIQTKYKAIDYTSLIPILIKGMQEQQAMIEELKSEVRQLKAQSEQKNQPRVVKASLKN